MKIIIVMLTFILMACTHNTDECSTEITEGSLVTHILTNDTLLVIEFGAFGNIKTRTTSLEIIWFNSKELQPLTKTTPLVTFD